MQKRVGMLVFGLWLALAQALAAQLVPGAPTTDWDRAHREFTLGVLREYNVLIGEWRDRLNAGEGRRAAEHYTARAQLLVPGRPALQGRDSIAAYLAHFAGGLLEIRTAVSEFLASDRLAYAGGALLLSAPDPTTGAVTSYAGHHVTLLLREGRAWRIHSQVLQYTPAGLGRGVPDGAAPNQRSVTRMAPDPWSVPNWAVASMPFR